MCQSGALKRRLPPSAKQSLVNNSIGDGMAWMGPDGNEGDNKLVSELPFTFSDLQVKTSAIKTTGRSVVPG